MADERLKKIYLAAGRLFNTKRYANTKVFEIAAEAGIATGTVYSLFTSKKAILTFVISSTFDDNFFAGDIALPVKEINEDILIELFKSGADKVYDEVLNITNFDGKVYKNFTQMISELFDSQVSFLLATNNIETNATIFPNLAAILFESRNKIFKLIEDNLTLYSERGEIRKLEYQKIHVQSIIDIITWWAMNSYVAIPSIQVPKEKAKEIALDLLTRAYLKKYE